MGVVDDGENPKPLARIVAHRSDPVGAEPSDNGQVEGEERTVAFVTPNEIFAADEAEGEALAAETRELGELIKAIDPESDA